jgi:phosphoribosylformylglycinamidine cyclo-ligase
VTGEPSGEKLTYASAGVDIDAAEDSKHRIKRLVESTFTAGARGAFGGFGGMFRVPEGMKQPLLVASADGVGTKIKIAIEADRHDTIGHCLVNHCVNDILVQGAKPLFFLRQAHPAVVEGVVAGVSAGCRENGASLIGGETAEMPGVYTPPDYDLAGFIVGAVEEDEVITSAGVKEGDVLVGLASTGLHTNGYSLARRIIRDRLRLAPHDPYPGAGGRSVADVMLAVHRSYLNVLGPVLGHIHAMAHITGGGIPGNLDRALPSHLDAVVEMDAWDIPTTFRVLEEAGGVDRAEMYRAFNMGVGMIVITDTAGAATVRDLASQAGVDNWIIGHTRPGSGRVHLV